VSESTVKVHVGRIMKKLNVTNRTQVVCRVYALSAAATLHTVLSRSVLEFDGAVSGGTRIRGQAARSNGLSASFSFRVCHPSTLRMVI
jgi:hypothetical protein